jgi:hypothetical protein
MRVVSDASALIALGQVGRLDLLPALYGSIAIPSGVRDELRSAELQRLLANPGSWLEVRPATPAPLLRALEADLDAEEAEAISLAVQVKADLLLIDERRGRAVATRLGLKVLGTLGVLWRPGGSPGRG